eukprot:TRINITY_DN8313_c0_g1_i2.p1 TRINITY_DN8313_c0_g1~~TRINITY_DN8313_c0_g1_i2.p1  ORF type:complete len:287 (-),score=44.69 TRINITY_DN8313_c0_g1_i2:103-963(-)
MSVRECLETVRSKVAAASEARKAALEPGSAPAPVRLVAVSKTKPAEALLEAYEAGHRCFGENYVHELLEKAPVLPEDVEWHFIGHLQSNKVGALIKGCPSLACLETIDSAKLARAVDKAWLAAGSARRLKVMVQVNSSGEETKNGVEAASAVELCRLIHTECRGLELAGLMTIGAPDYSGCRTEDFETLHKCRAEVAADLGIDLTSVELSMGMSSDFETAIKEGSTSVRVGSSIFGARVYPNKAKAVPQPATQSEETPTPEAAPAAEDVQLDCAEKAYVSVADWHA